MKIDLKKIWSGQESASSKQVVRERILFIKDLNCFIGLVGYTGVKMFQLEVEPLTEIHKNYLHRFRGVEIQAIPSDDETLKKFTIILMEKELTDIFTLFIEDILDKLIPISDTKDALNIINQRVIYWRKLFAQASGELLTPEKQRGLFGELFILQQLLNYSEDSRLVLNSWVGPQSANQDFVIETNAIEVKTSKAGNSTVSISNEYQLDFTLWNNIYLCIVSVNESAGKQGTLFQLINTIRTLLEERDDELVSEFERKLGLIGINRDMLEEYNETSYSVRNYRFFHVCDGFPVIVKGTIESDAIYNVKYQIDISKCRDFEADEQTVLSTIL